MRFTLACSWCRKSKVKCHHNGSPPCRGCTLNPGRDCVLTYPPKPSSRHLELHRRASRTVSRQSRHEGQHHADDRRSPLASHEETPSILSRGRLSNPVTRPSLTLSSTEDDLRSLAQAGPGAASTSLLPEREDRPHCQLHYSVTAQSRSDLVEKEIRNADPFAISSACDQFVHMFPEFGFLHQPTLLEDLQANRIDSLKVAAILALSRRQRHDNPQNDPAAETAGMYAEYIREAVMHRAVDYPHVDVVQVLVMLSLYDWGNGNGFKAWMHLGMAIRMGEALLVNPDSTAKGMTFLQHETIIRTLWACFILDCVLSGGKGRKESFQVANISFPLPCSDDDFTFQSEPQEDGAFLHRLAYSSTSSFLHNDTSRLNFQHHSRIIIQGFDIWSVVTNWINAGGRRKEYDTESALPWNESSVWNKSLIALRQWRDSINPQLIYSPTNSNLRAFALRKQGPAFAMINILYHVTAVFLHREYIPFLPHRVSRPRGPIDAPLLPQTHPLGWWEGSAHSLFSSAATIVDIMRDLEKNDVQLQTPFIGFWMYTAAFTLHYGYSWPHMTEEVPDLLPRFQWAFKWLQQLSLTWRICEGWCKTIENLEVLYNGIKQDVPRYLEMGRDDFIELEDNVQRVAEVETPRSATGEPASILVALSRSEPEPHRENRQENYRGVQNRYHIQREHHGSNPLSAQFKGANVNKEGNNRAYYNNTVEDFDDLMRNFIANQDSITNLIGEPIPDNSFISNIFS